MYIRDNFLYLSWGCTSIYRPALNKADNADVLTDENIKAIEQVRSTKIVCLCYNLMNKFFFILFFVYNYEQRLHTNVIHLFKYMQSKVSTCFFDSIQLEITKKKLLI